MNKGAAAHPAMLLIERLLDRLFPGKVMMLVCLLDAGILRGKLSSGLKTADRGWSLVPPAGGETVNITVRLQNPEINTDPKKLPFNRFKFIIFN